MFRDLRIGKFFQAMLIFIPISFYLAFFTTHHTLTFIASILALIPLARIIGYSTEQIALQTNSTIGGLLSATFGNIIELIIAILALRAGLVEVVKASIIGSILGNLLLLIGLSIFAGGLRYKYQKFNKETMGVSSTMLIIAVAGLTLPSLYAFLGGSSPHISMLSDLVCVVLALTYIANLVFSMLTHRDMFDASDEIRMEHLKMQMTKKEAAMWLLFGTIFAAIISEFLVSGIQNATTQFGITQTFIGIVIIAIITNIAENTAAISFSLQNKLDLSMEIGMSSAIQIALFVVPILVFLSALQGYGFYLIFSIFQVVSVLLAVMIINYLSADGRCNWLEGIQLISVYLIIAIAFYFI